MSARVASPLLWSRQRRRRWRKRQEEEGCSAHPRHRSSAPYARAVHRCDWTARSSPRRARREDAMADSFLWESSAVR
eukprot:scaffold253271_cov31-Tisochrysis_lutea.AAC.1